MLRATRVLRAASHHHAGHGAGASKEFGGFVPPHVNPVHQRIATFIGATMWFWIFYRAKQDGGVVLGLWKPWEAHGDHGDEHHGEGHHGEGHHGEGHGEEHADAHGHAAAPHVAVHAEAHAPAYRPVTLAPLR